MTNIFLVVINGGGVRRRGLPLPPPGFYRGERPTNSMRTTGNGDLVGLPPKAKPYVPSFPPGDLFGGITCTPFCRPHHRIAALVASAQFSLLASQGQM